MHPRPDLIPIVTYWLLKPKASLLTDSIKSGSGSTIDWARHALDLYNFYPVAGTHRGPESIIFTHSCNDANLHAEVKI